MTEPNRERIALARRLAAALAALPGVRAVALGGSVATGAADGGSDIDLYCYGDRIPAVEERRALVRDLGAAPGAEVGNSFFEPGDEWRDAGSGVAVDVMYRLCPWAEDRLDAVLRRHEASLGYSTALWHNIRTARPLADAGGWLAALRARAEGPYPKGLARAVVALNWGMLAETANRWPVQLEGALGRSDAVAAGHRTTAMLASWFDVLFALNRRTHPGEKRLLRLAAETCPLRPEGWEDDVRALLAAAGRCDPAASEHAARLVDGLRPLVAGR